MAEQAAGLRPLRGVAGVHLVWVDVYERVCLVLPVRYLVTDVII